MEESKKKWLCPNCKTGSVAKKDPNKKPLNQQKLTKFFSKNLKESTDEDVPKANLCVVCGENPTRLDSIYCSDVCIQSHATKHTDDPSTPLPQQQVANMLINLINIKQIICSHLKNLKLSEGIYSRVKREMSLCMIKPPKNCSRQNCGRTSAFYSSGFRKILTVSQFDRELTKQIF